MKTITMLLTTLLAGSPALHAAENTGTSRIVSAGLFKNGLAVITREYTVPGPGNHEFSGVPAPIHGTLWIESAPDIVVRTGSREIVLSGEDAPIGNLGESLIGKAVRLGFHDKQTAAALGTLLAIPGNAGTNQRASWDVYGNPVAQRTSAFYVLAHENGHRSYITPHTVAYIRTEGDSPTYTHTTTRPVLTVEVPDSQVGPATIRATYLTRGMAWTPSYRLDITDPDRIRVQQSAILRNELEEMENVPLDLISGFPSVEYAHVTSPLATSVNWNAFFQQLNAAPGQISRDVTQISNISTLFHNASGGFDIPTMAEGPDIHYQPIGTHSLKRNEAMTLVLASAEAAYEPVVEWNVKNTNGGDDTVDLWDAVRFKNPFPFPMTTGPAMVVADGHFLGSKTTRWVNPGDETLAYVTKTLSVRVNATEKEGRERESVVTAWRKYSRSTVDGTLSLRNLRNEPVSVIIRKELRGELLSADQEPNTVVGEAGPGHINPSTKLTWTLEIPAGEEATLNYRYHYLVD